MTPEQLQRLKELYLKIHERTGSWEVGGPWPSVTVIYCVDGGCGLPEPEPPIYEPVCVIHQETEDYNRPSPEAVVELAELISLMFNSIPDLLKRAERIQTNSTSEEPINDLPPLHP